MSQRAPQLAVDTCARRLRSLDGIGPLSEADCHISWYGPARFSPDRPGSEASVQALSGLMEVHGRDQRTPRRLGLEVASVAAGILAAQGAIAGALAGMRGGPVPEVRTSVLQAGLVLLSHYFVVATGLGDALQGDALQRDALPAPGPPFRSAEGRWFEMETLDIDPWKGFWTRLGAADAELARAWTTFRWRYERASCTLPQALHDATAKCSLAQLQRVAEETGVSLVPLRSYEDVLAEAGAIAAARPTVRPWDVADRRSGTGVQEQPPPSRDGGLPLQGIRVVEATSRIQGPFAGLLLRMLGADVVRVQPPEGDYGRAALTLHRGKESVSFDLGTPAGRAQLLELVADADVFLHNWRPGKADEWTLAFEDLAPRHPRLVYATASGWGDRPEAGRVLGTDFLVQAHTGLGHGLRPDGEPPFPSRVILADLFGGLVGAEAILRGLYRREHAGGAWEARSSLLAGAMSLQAHVLEDLADGKENGRRDGRPVWGVLDRPLPTADGMLATSVEDDESFRRLCRLCEVDPAGAPRAVTEQRLAAHLASGTAAGWEEALSGAGVAAAVVCQDLAAVPADPRLSELFEPVDAGGVAPRSPWSFR